MQHNHPEAALSAIAHEPPKTLAPSITADSPAEPGAVYRHFKGGQYVVVCEATEESTGAPLVVYRGTDGRHWTRPRDNFFSMVEHEGRHLPRFSLEAAAPSDAFATLSAAFAEAVVAEASKEAPEPQPLAAVAMFIEVEAGVRYWEDGCLDGQDDVDGKMPLRKEDAWCPIIALDTGRIVDWPQGHTAYVHYKVCDDGLYWLLDAQRRRIATWRGHYVPNAFLCPTENGYGDYIIFGIDENGQVQHWTRPCVDEDDWKRSAPSET